MDIPRGFAFLVSLLTLLILGSVASLEARSDEVDAPETAPPITYSEEFFEVSPPHNPEDLVSFGDDVTVANLTEINSVASSAMDWVPAGESDEETDAGSISMNYYGIFYGPALKNGGSFLPGPNGERELEKTILVKNWMGLGVYLADRLNVGGYAYWHWKPVRGQQLSMQDPYLKASYDRVIQSGPFKLYSDLRVHLPATAESRAAELRAGVQTVQIATVDQPESRWAFNVYGSARSNFFGKKGYGYDLELYLGPSVLYQIGNHVAINVLYEMAASHAYGAKPWAFSNDGTDLEPGITWDVTPNLNINPYLNLYTGNKVSLETTSVGMLLSWKML